MQLADFEARSRGDAGDGQRAARDAEAVADLRHQHLQGDELFVLHAGGQKRVGGAIGGAAADDRLQGIFESRNGRAYRDTHAEDAHLSSGESENHLQPHRAAIEPARAI